MKLIATVLSSTLLLVGCGPASWPSQVKSLTADDVPSRFAFPEGSETATPACGSPITDPRDGSTSTLVRSQGGLGDYRPAPGRHGLAEDELLRVDCRDGRPLGAVRREP